MLKHMLILAILAGALKAGQAFAQPYPAKPIRFIVPAGPGSSADVRARMFGSKAAELLGQPVIAENRPGAETVIGAEAAYRASPDGYTILYATAQTLSVNPWLFANLPYKPDDFMPVTLLTSNAWFLAIGASVPARNMAELVQLAKSQPGKLTYASSGDGSYAHLFVERLKALTGADIAHVPYKTTAAELPDLLAGRVDIGFNGWPVYAQQFRSGKLKPLAVAFERRMTAVAPDIPTSAEAGFAGLEMNIWGSVVAPPGTPPAIARRLQREFLRVLAAPDVVKDILQAGSEPGGQTPDQFAEFLKSDRARWERIVRDAKLKPRNL